MFVHRCLTALALLAAGAFVAPTFADDEPTTEKKEEKAKKDRTAKKEKEKATPLIAQIRLHGSLDETPISEGIFGVAGENLRMKLDRIKKAKNDPNVKALLLDVENVHLGLFGFGKVEEVRRAIQDFRSSGKKAYAYLEEAGGIEYLIALACDEICMPEGGSFEFLGLRIEMSFYKELLDKIGVKADFLQMGEAKGAAEPYTRTEMSEANRKQYNLVLDDLYDNSVIKAIVASRPSKKWTPEAVKKIIDDAPYGARQAKELGLVDRVAYREAMEEEVKKLQHLADIEVTKDYGKAKSEKDDNPFSALMKLMNPPKKSSSKKPKIAVIYAVGAIEHGKGGEGLFGGSVVGSTPMVDAIRQAEKDETVKAIVLRVDSPGGSALASDLIWHELRQSKKPTVASMGDIAASGGYYISMGCDRVFAEPGTLTGSIGVVGGKLALRGLEEWAGIRTEVLSRGRNTGANSGTFEFSKSERDAMTRLMQEIYDQFLDKTVQNRKAAGVDLTREKLIPMAGGRIWTGRQAKERGLVDELGTLPEALAYAKEKAKMAKDSEPELLILPEQTSFLERLLEDGPGLRLEKQILSQFSGVGTMPEAREHLRALDGLLRLRGERVWMALPYGLKVK